MLIVLLSQSNGHCHHRNWWRVWLWLGVIHTKSGRAGAIPSAV